MKNIHVLPTDKPSRIRIGNNGNFVIGLTQSATASKNDSYTNQHIYITSDEEIKEGDWFLPQGHINPHKLKGYNKINGDLESYNGLCYDISKCKKIILTTDQDLIKDGVQAIDDEFLEWFVKNPSCEEVEVKEVYFNGSGYYDENQLSEQEKVLYSSMKEYKIIIPKEEPKKYKVIIVGDGLPKQETLEEFIQRQLSLGKYQDQESAIKYSILAGAKWQQEQDKNKFSEEDMHKLMNEYQDYLFKTNDPVKTFKEWFKQFKNK